MLFHEPLLTEEWTIFVYFSGVVALIFWLGEMRALSKFFKFFPPLIWTYFVPMIGTTLGITPAESHLYSWMRIVILPAVLVILLVPTDIRYILKLGPKAIFVMLSGTLGVMLGGIIGFAMFQHWLPAKAWTGIGALSGSWIGGSSNFLAIAESVNAPASIIGPLIVVDTVICYSWLGILIALSAYQDRIDRWNKADSSTIEAINLELEAISAKRRPMTIKDMTLMLGFAFVISTVCMKLGTVLPPLGKVVNAYTWGILIITGLSLFLSFTPARKIEYCGASALGYTGLYLLLASIGAQADLTAVTRVPLFFLVGLVWLAVHIIFISVGTRIFRAPLFLTATGSMANMGGTASAPVVAAAYQPSMAPFGLLLAVLGAFLGTPLGLIVAQVCSMIATK
jgi:uncharacterized membrane protein